MNNYVVGIDFGTLSGRCVLVDVKSGEEKATAISEYKHKVMSEELEDGTPLSIDWALQDPQDYLDVLETTIREVMTQAKIRPDQIVGIGVDFTSCTMLPIMEDGTAVCKLDGFASEPNAYVKLWKHHAAQYEADKLNKIAAERGEKFLGRYGGKISSEWLFPKIMQILDEAPAVYETAFTFVEAGDWIVKILTNVLVRNNCSAGYKALWHKKEGFPSKEFFAALDGRLEHVIEEKIKGPVKEIGTRAGRLTKSGARLTGLLEGTAVATAHLDAGGATVGAGIMTPGKMLIMMGTSSCHILLGDKECEVPGMCGMVEDGVVPGFIGYEAGQSCVGDHFQWLVENAVPCAYEREAEKAGLNIHQYLSDKAAGQLPGESGIVALDWWNGNRSVLVDGKLSGLLLGCTLQTKPEDIYRALIEATAYGTRKIIDTFEEHGVPVEEVIVAGGIAEKNPFMMQVYADVTGKSIKIAGSKQNAALSSAIWAAVAAGKEAGGYDSLLEAVAAMSSRKELIYLTNQEAKETYDLLYKEYEILHDYFGRGANDVMKRLKTIMDRQQKKNREGRN